MKRSTLILIWGLVLVAGATATRAQYIPVNPNPYGERPVIIPVPTTVAGVTTPVLTFNEGWKSKEGPEADFWRNDASRGWADYRLDSTRWGLRTPNRVVAYRNTIDVPATFAGSRVVLRFNGTAHDAKLWVNGRHVRDHWGSYASWTADITDFVKPGERARVDLQLDQRSQGLAAFVRYSAGIHGDVQLFAVPRTHIQRFRIDTDLDNEYRDATMRLWLMISDNAPARGGKVRVSLTGPDGRSVRVTPAVFDLPADMAEFKYDLSVRNPIKWDAEHPNLHTVTLSLVGPDGKVTQTITRKMGFREVERRGNQLFVNGREVKFRGTWGAFDARQMRDLNINHVRHKYMTEKLLDDCDEYGVYVLHENSVDFAKFSVESDPQYAYQWLAQIADMMERDWNHPSVVMWGLGNESFNGPNILPTHKYVRADDSQRPTMFSWANRVPIDEELPYDVYSYHYPEMANPNIDLSDYGVSIWHSESLIVKRSPRPELPVIADEAIHVVISRDEAQRDPNVRNFWGESVKNSWDVVWRTKGALGQDQFGMFTDMPHWEMPEQWLIRKGYSPFVITDREFDIPSAGNPLNIPVENRFNHTNLKEISIHWKVGEKSGVVKGPDTEPFGRGTLTIPHKEWKRGDKLDLRIVRADGCQVDEYVLDISPEPFTIPGPPATAPTLEQNDKEIVVSGKDFRIVYNKYAGQITSGTRNGKTVITGGPHLQLLGSGLSLQEYWANNVDARMEGNEAVIRVDAIYSPIIWDYELRIDGNGLITVNYTIKHIPDPPPVTTTIPWSQADLGGYREVGIVFTVPGEVDRLEWNRRGLWSVYPDDHIGREKGVAFKTNSEPNVKVWGELTRDWNWMGGGLATSTITNDFRASKEYIRTATALLSGSGIGLQAVSQEKDAVRMELAGGNNAAGPLRMVINNLWNYPTLGVGNWMKPAIMIGNGYKNSVRVRMVDTTDNVE